MKFSILILTIVTIVLFSSIASAVSLNMNGGSVNMNGVYSYDYVNLTNGAVININAYNGTATTGTLTLNIKYDLNIDSTSSINGNVKGFRGGAGGSAGTPPTQGIGGEAVGAGGGSDGSSSGGCTDASGAGAGSYGTTGGYGGAVPCISGGANGTIQGTTSGFDIQKGNGGGGGGGGSFGGGGAGSQGQAGGAMLAINATSVYVFGTINMNGGIGGAGGAPGCSPSCYGGGGGGGASGGGILFNVTSYANFGGNGTLNASGGAGGASGGNGAAAGAAGGGGRIKVFYGTYTAPSVLTAGTTYTNALYAPPSVPVNTFHSNYHAANSTTVNWSTSTDPNGYSITYYYNIGTSSGGTDVANNVSTTTTGSAAFTEVQTNSYYWKVKACNPFGCSAYSAETSFSFTNTAPTTPSTTAPANGTVNYSSTSINMTWAASTDANGDPLNYTWQWSNKSDFSSLLNNTNTTNTYSGTIQFANNSYYYGRVRSNDNWSSSSWSTTITYISGQLLIQLSPANGSTGVSNYINLTWDELPVYAPYTYQVATDSGFTSITVSGSTNNKYTGNLTLAVNTKYYWHVKNSTSGYLATFEFTTAAVSSVPGQLNVTVFDEQNLSKRIMEFTASLYNSSAVVTKSTTTGWTNFTTEILGQSEYLIIVVPTGNYSNYYQRMELATDPANVTMYVPNGTLPNTIDLVSFSLLDVTGLFPYTTSKIFIYKGGLLQESSYFSQDGTHAMYMIQGTNYNTEVRNGNNVFYGQNYIPTGSGTSSITINDFTVNYTALNPFTYNISSSPSQIVLNWNSSVGTITNINFTVHQGTAMTLLCQQTSALATGQVTCGIDNTTQYHIIFSALLTDGTFRNTSYIVDYSYGHKKTSTGTNPTTGLPIGTGFKWNYGTWTTPDWLYNFISLILIVVLGGSFGTKYNGMGGIITLIMALILEGTGLFQPLGDSDLSQFAVMGITGGMLFLAILYYMQHKEKYGVG